jgi:hypothetical protein
MAVLTRFIRAIAVLACCLAVCGLSGCRNLDNAQVDVLERELRQQEDYIYELEDYLVEYSEKLRQARMIQCQPVSSSTKAGSAPAPRAPLREPTIDDDPIERPSLPLNGRNKPVPPLDDAPAAAESIVPPSGTESPAVGAPASELKDEAEPERVDPDNLEAPELEIGPVGKSLLQSAPLATGLNLQPDANAEGPLLIPDPIDYQADTDAPVESPTTQASAQPAGEPELASPQANAARLSAQQLKIRRVFAEPGKDGNSPASLLVVVEAVNATDEPVDAVGAASLMIMARDPSGSLKRLERWDFTAEETAAAWQSSQLGDGLHLELPLTKSELPEGALELWARVVDANGVKLLTDADDPYRFEAAGLASMADSPPETVLASNETSEPISAGADSVQPPEIGSEPATQAVAVQQDPPKSNWRASGIPLNKDRVEGFATTAGGKASGWTTTPIDGKHPRIASATSKNGSPTWKRSSRAAAAADPRPEWTPDR